VGQTARPPYFFLSYAHDQGEDDRSIKRFHQRLLHDVRLLSGDATATGFCDTTLRAGERWSPALIRHLSTAQVFVAVMSPMYFERESCGREWAVFSERMAAAESPDESESSLIPLLWVSMDVPAVARPYQYRDVAFGDAYAERRLRGLLRNEQHPDFGDFVERLGRRIVELNRTRTVPPAPRGPQFDEVTPAFPEPPSRRPRIVPQRAETEPRRDPTRPPRARPPESLPRLNPAHLKKDDAP
jgi:hypothetical protein